MNPLDLLLLACPAMMVVCVFGMRGRGGRGGEDAAQQSVSVPRHTDANAVLEERLADLMVENDALRRELTASGGSGLGSGATPVAEGLVRGRG